MKSSLKKLTAVLIAAIMVMTTFVAFPTTASAAIGTPDKLEGTKIAVWADPENVLTQGYIDDYNSGTSKTSALGTVQPFQLEASSIGGNLGGNLGGGLGGLIPDIGGSSGSGSYYLFLPSTTDCSALKLWLASGSTLSINGTPITSGAATDVFAQLQAGGTAVEYTFTLDNKDYKVKVMKSGEVGTIYIDTQSGSLKDIQSNKDKYESGTIMVVQPDGTVDYMGNLEKIKGRGNGTWDSGNTKNPYSIKLAKSTSLLGMGKAKKWALLASTGSGSDNTLVANQLAYDFSDYIGVRYQVHCKPADLYVNQQYLGSYQLAEKVEIKSNRVALQSDAYENLELANATVDAATGAIVPADFETSKPSVTNGVGSVSSLRSTLNIGGKKYSPSIANNPADITGGYIYQLEISKRLIEEENNGFCGYNKQCWVIASADYATKQMIDYSYDLFYALGSSVYNKGTVTGATDTYNGKKWSDLLDADSAVKYYWTQEFFKNMDCSTSSTYFYKESDSLDSKLYAGPVWDMDNSMGHTGDTSSRWGVSLTSYKDWYAKNVRIYRYQPHKANGSSTTDPLSFYAALATNCSDFWEMAEDYWYNTISPAVDILLGNKIDETGKLNSIDYYVNTVEKSAVMDAVRFGTTYNAASVKTTLNEWITGRQNWINSQFTVTKLADVKVNPIDKQYYTGNSITPAITVTYNSTNLGTLTLKEGVDYTVEYQNNINVGTAAAKITGINGYSGLITQNFSIIANPLNESTLTIEEQSYSDVEINAKLLGVNGVDLTDSDKIAYQWYKNGTAISGATGKTYLATADDKGAVITVTATGDGKSVTGSVTSNECTVLNAARPTGFEKTIAAWDYDYTADNTTLTNASTTPSTYYYPATSGLLKESANLYASVDAETSAPIEWSGKNDLYKNESSSVTDDRAPIMGTSKTNGISWGFFPYFETVVSTKGYENITFSAKLGGTKKAPKYWNLQYSLDGVDYIDIDNSNYAIVANTTMEQAFSNVPLPSECDNQSKLYIRITVNDNVSIDGLSEIVLEQSGDAAINNIQVKGASLSVINELSAPVIDTTDSVLFDDKNVTITDTNGGADIYYTVNGGSELKYEGPFNPFDTKTAKIGDTATITAYAFFNGIRSAEVPATVTFGGVNINSFVYRDYSKDVTSGAVQSTSGVYGESGLMTANADGTAMYVPLWRADNGSFSVAPDDGLKWSAESGFTYAIRTAGYENVKFSCMAYTTNNGPKSVTLQYSTNGTDFINIKENTPLTANNMLEQLFLNFDLPAACDNQETVYLRLATTEDSTFGGSKLHSNLPKGNLYVNDVIISGEDNGDIKRPYTNKSTSYFGDTGVIEYISPDGLPMQYVVLDSNNKQVLSGTYTAPGIMLSTASGFDKTKQQDYTVLIEAIADEDNKSAAVADTYRYKGETVVKFNYNNSTRPFINYVAADNLSVSNTSGTNAGTLSMYPNGKKAAELTYSGGYGVRVSWSLNNPFAVNKEINKVEGNGYWLIETSTKGFTNLTLNAEQMSSNKGPRDWAIAYSTNGTNYTFIDNSNVRAISNDSASKPVETFGNIPLDSACDNQEKLYIKIFINGGESVDGTELDDPSINKGNTGINGFEINGIAMPTYVDINTTLLEHIGDTTGNINVSDVDIYVDGIYKATTDENGLATIGLAAGIESTITLQGSGVATRTVTIKPTADMPAQNIAVMAYDINGDGYVNAKDYAIITKDSKYSSYKEFFPSFINVKNDQFTY